jgi:hypothetical protein
MSAEDTVGAPTCLVCSLLIISLSDLYLVAFNFPYNFAAVGILQTYLCTVHY